MFQSVLNTVRKTAGYEVADAPVENKETTVIKEATESDIPSNSIDDVKSDVKPDVKPEEETKKESTMFQSIVNTVRKTAGYEVSDVPVENKESKLANEEEQTEEESRKEENTLIAILEKARSVYIEKGLKGTISITRSFTIFYRSVSCDIDGIAERNNVELEELGVDTDGVPIEKPLNTTSGNTSFEKVAIACVDRCIHSLERRATPYSKKKYRSELSLSNTVYSSIPILGFLSINVTCSATVSSLVAAAEASAKAKTVKEAS